MEVRPHRVINRKITKEINVGSVKVGEGIGLGVIGEGVGWDVAGATVGDDVGETVGGNVAKDVTVKLCAYTGPGPFISSA